MSDEIEQVQKSLNISLQTRRDLLRSNRLKMDEIEAALIEFDKHIIIKDREIDNIGSVQSHKSHKSCKLRSARLVSKERELAARGAEAETNQEVSLNSENPKDFCFDDYKKRFLGEMRVTLEYKQALADKRDRRSDAMVSHDPDEADEGNSIGSHAFQLHKCRFDNSENARLGVNDGFDIMDEDTANFTQTSSNNRKRSETVDHNLHARRKWQPKRATANGLFSTNIELEEGVYCVQMPGADGSPDRSLFQNSKIRPRVATSKAL